MTGRMSINTAKPPNSPAGREIVEVLDQLIMLRIAQLQGNPIDGDRLEELKRMLTDTFLAIDPRPGIYVHGSHRT